MPRVIWFEIVTTLSKPRVPRMVDVGDARFAVAGAGDGGVSRTGFHGDRVSWLPLFISREILVSFYGA
jgi:hypothetical protein